MRIVVNESIARPRKRGRSAEVIRLDVETEADNESAEAGMNESIPEQPEHAAQRAGARQLLEAKIDALPVSFRKVFVLKALEKMSVEETAAALGVIKRHHQEYC